ncbi:MAG: phosphoribosylformylglycinamidine synthase subunit PurS [Candidatus Micrarchaeota archaeon]|nr:phosphoribosylformylglycinamidine synthase subunit PurS [Candidatus Micrarchaeota archaeon]
MKYIAELIIEPKPAAKDPEGETIKRDLMNKNGFAMVESVRSAKLLKITLEAKNENEARAIAEKMTNDLRLANPVAQNYSIVVRPSK